MDQSDIAVIFSENKLCKDILERITQKCFRVVKTFSNEAQTVDFVRNNEVSLVVISCDEGSSTCNIIRGANKKTPIILVSKGVEDYSLYFKNIDTVYFPLDAEVLLRKIKLHKTLLEATKTLESISHNRRSTDELSKKL